MNSSDDISFSPAEFSGVTRLFPLPNHVMFPHVVQPFHIFEQRYRDMVEDVLESDHLFTMVQLLPGWEPEYEGRPPVAPVGCLGKVLSHVQLEGGRYNLLLAGVQRIQILEELEPTASYREARGELLEDHYEAGGASRRQKIREQLLSCVRSYVPQLPEVHQQLDELLDCAAPLGMLTDVVSHLAQLDAGAKQDLLSETSVDVRAQTLLNVLKDPASQASIFSRGTFPPGFSLN